MSTFSNPFSSAVRFMKGCICGKHHSQAEHERTISAEAVDAPPSNDEGRFRRVVETAVMRAMFPVDAERRAFLKAVGASTAAAALATFFPVGIATDVLAQTGPIEKKTSRSASSPSPARRRSSWRTRWGSIRSRVSMWR